MLKKTISYTDFDGVAQTEDFYFNITKAELVEMNLRADGAFQDHLTAIVESKNGQLIMDKFREIIDLSYGERSEDGKRFIKSKELSTNFSQTAAFDTFFMELVTNANAASDFINGLMPSDLTEAVRKNDRPVLQDHLKKVEPAAKRLEEPTLAVQDADESYEAYLRTQRENKLARENGVVSEQ